MAAGSGAGWRLMALLVCFILSFGFLFFVHPPVTVGLFAVCPAGGCTPTSCTVTATWPGCRTGCASAAPSASSPSAWRPSACAASSWLRCRRRTLSALVMVPIIFLLSIPLSSSYHCCHKKKKKKQPGKRPCHVWMQTMTILFVFVVAKLYGRRWNCWFFQLCENYWIPVNV